MAQRKRHTPELKVKITLEATREEKTANQIASEYGAHAAQESQRKRQALEQMARDFWVCNQEGVILSALKCDLLSSGFSINVIFDMTKNKKSS